ncbi:HAD family hydrolase [Flavicella sediminum]|uniref:HAD family hydrolase n=1 Tax=Flavicella sediminum TaxID=2585141 RepID=UPI001120ED82|nr:HAD family hydrolase [Flavicella sediminum]
MDYSKVKMVITDMDGTLLNSNHEVSDKFFKLFPALLKQNIHFVAASGRQYDSILGKLESIKNDITIVAENGGFGKQGETILFSRDLAQEKINETILAARKIKNPYIVLCGLNSAYVESKDAEFVATFSQFYTSFTIVDDLTKVTNDTFFKVAIFNKECSETHVLPFVKHLDTDLQVTVSGKNWLDISHHDANKGVAIKYLQEKLNITKAETMVFGDYNNDLTMLALSDYSYAMKNAHPNVKAIANYETKSNDENGVEFILEQVIR